MDRDIAVNLLGKLKNYKDKIEEINDNKYVPHIITQPVDFVGAVDDRATFTVVANNVKGYQWQVRDTAGGDWANSGSAGNKSATLSLTVTTARYKYRYRCVITGQDNSQIITDEVKMVAPTT